nr:uncharacterized protein LOC129381602 [Dermacentor andersoni]
MEERQQQNAIMAHLPPCRPAARRSDGFLTPPAAWCHLWNTQHGQITDVTYYVDGVTDNGSTSYLHQGFTSSIDYARPSASGTGMDEASAIIEGGTKISGTTGVDHWKTQYHHPADGTSTLCVSGSLVIAVTDTVKNIAIRKGY